MNPGTFAFPTAQAGLINLGTKQAAGTKLTWYLPPKVRRLTLMQSRVTSSLNGVQSLLRLGLQEPALALNYACMYTFLAAATLATTGDVTAHIMSQHDANTTQCSGLTTLMRDDYNNWVIVSTTSRYLNTSNLYSLTSLAGNGAAGIQTAPRGEMKLLEVSLNGGASYTSGVFSLIGEMDAFPA